MRYAPPSTSVQQDMAAAMTMVLLVGVMIAVGGLLLFSRDMDDTQ